MTPTIIGAMADGTPVVGVGVVATVVEKRAVTGDGGGPFVMVSGAVDAPAVGAVLAANNYTNRQVLQLGDVVNISMGMGPNVGTVALDARTVFATSNATYLAQGARTPTKALKVGTLTVTITGDINGATAGGVIYTLDPGDPAVEVDDQGNADPTDDEFDLDNSLAGNVDVVVKGAFKTGDMVVYGTPPTPAKIADGMAAVSVPITAVGSSTDIIYVPGGVDALRPGNITAMAMLNFSRAGNNPGKAATSAGVISYAGVDIDAYAQGVVRGGGTDSSYLRVRCSSATDCTVFLDCHDQDGNNYFDEAGTIGDGETAVWSSDDVAAVFGGGWGKGRGACDLMSNGTLEVQHMVRSGHTLVNNSAVVGRSLSEARLASIDKALADICASVEGHGARMAVDANDDGDVTDAGDSAAIVATMCSNTIGKLRDLSAIDTTPGAGDGNAGL